MAIKEIRMALSFFRCIALMSFMLLAVAPPAPAMAQPYPTKPVTLVIPFAAGGPSDTIGRLVAAKMGDKLGQTIVVENIAGAGGTIAAGRVAKLPADGYTLLLHHIALPLGAALYKNLSYDTATAFETLGMINYGPYVLTTKLDYGANTPKELFESFKANAEKTTFAHAGIGSGSHMCGLMLMQALGFKSNFVAYRGTGPALNDVVAGHVDVLCDQTTNTFPQIEGKKIKPFAITSAQRSPKFPDIPTMAEVGLTDLELSVWHALYAPKGLPADVKGKIVDALLHALSDKDVAVRFDQLGTSLFVPAERSTEAHNAKLQSELKRMREVVAKAGVEATAN
jgi:tripartite-type tricarboxylate transporter receptor subunit TctC